MADDIVSISIDALASVCGGNLQADAIDYATDKLGGNVDLKAGRVHWLDDNNGIATAVVKVRHGRPADSDFQRYHVTFQGPGDRPLAVVEPTKLERF